MHSFSNGTIEKEVFRRNKHIFRQFLKGPGPMYPNLYLQISYFVNSKTELINPATKDEDVKILVSPYGEHGMTEAFNAPAGTVSKEVHKALLEFSFVYFVEFAGIKVSGGYKDFINVEKEIKTGHAPVLVEGSLNTVTGEHHVYYRKY